MRKGQTVGANMRCRMEAYTPTASAMTTTARGGGGHGNLSRYHCSRAESRLGPYTIAPYYA